MSAPHAVLLDLDGTLVDLAAPGPELDELRAALAGLAARESVPIEHTGIFSMYRALCAAGRGVAEARRLLDRYETSWARSTARPLVTAHDVVGTRYRTGLVTSNGRACVEVLHERGLLPRLDVEVTRDDCLQLKPAAEPLAMAVAALGPLPDEAELAYVGDSPADRAAVEAYVGTHAHPVIHFLPAASGTGSSVPPRPAARLLAACGDDGGLATALAGQAGGGR